MANDFFQMPNCELNLTQSYMILKKQKLIIVLIISFLSVVISCKPTFDLRVEKDAAEQIVEDIKNKKIIFIGNNHDSAFQSLFLKENLFDFYKAGVRYIFLEGNSNHYIDEQEDYSFYLFPAWARFGYRFEEVLIGDEIQRINKLYKHDPIKVILPEEGLEIKSEEWADDTLEKNIRDKFIQKKIIEIMDNTDSKALILYGDAHGLKKTEVWNPSSKNPYWTRLGFYLDNHYGSEFCTYYFYPYSTDKRKKVLYSNASENNMECKSLSEENINLIIKIENSERDYDHYCLYKKWIHAVPIYYVPTEENLKYMLSFFLDGKLLYDKKIDVLSKKSGQLFALYYLKYHLGERFDYDYRYSDEQLRVALEKLRNEDLVTLPYNLEELEFYNYLLTEWISSYVCDHAVAINYIDRDLSFFLDKMSQAQKINSRDIWPQYWIAYFRTEKASSSGKKTDYQKAMDEWEKLFQNDLFYASPIIGIAYKKMALCAEKTDNVDKALIYKQKENDVNPLLDIDFEYYKYFGW